MFNCQNEEINSEAKSRYDVQLSRYNDAQPLVD